MTLKEIKAMFQPATVWVADNSYNPRANGLRKVRLTTAGMVAWESDSLGRFSSPFPMASQILEAREGYLRYQIHTAGQCDPRQNTWSVEDTLTLVRA